MSENALRDAFVECVENNAFQIELPTSRVKILMGKLDANFENMHTEEDCIKVCQSFYSRNIKVFLPLQECDSEIHRICDQSWRNDECATKIAG